MRPPAASAPDPVAHRARVATWNLWWRFGPWRRRGRAIVEVLRAVDAQVIALQEVWSTSSTNQAQLLAEELGMHAAWTPAADGTRFSARLGDPDVAVGTAVLSRWPIVDVAQWTLPSAEMHLACATVDAPGALLPVFNVHLDPDPAGSARRCEQVRELWRCIAAHAGADLPVVLAGDLNAEPDSDEVRLLAGHKTAPAVPGRVLVDTWRFADHCAPSATWATTNPYVAHLGFPDSRIDYVFAGPPTRTCPRRVVHASRFGDEPVDGVWASDHFGVLAELVW
jgi:endonuclease/exonuclease/phosphatase family metal-dependent hydrolase